MDRAVVVSHLTKDFEVSERRQGLVGSIGSFFRPTKKTVHALDGVSFTIDEGELVGFIGPNGAGKTTTLKVLSGLLYPTSGHVAVLGHNPWNRKEKFLKSISLVMGQKNQLWWDLPAMETFELNRAIYDIPKSKFKKSLDELVELLAVGDLLTTQVRRLSLGQRMRLELVAALLHRPQVLFLDEPTLGLDVIGQQKLREFIAHYNKKHKATILLTSHNMDDVSDLAKRVIVISGGKLIFDGKMTELIDSFAKQKIIKLTLSKAVDYKKLEKVGKIVSINLPRVVISVSRTVAAVAASELLQSMPVDDVTIEEEPVESIIRKVFGAK